MVIFYAEITSVGHGHPLISGSI